MGRWLFWALFGILAGLALAACGIALAAFVDHQHNCGPNSTVTFHSADCKDSASLVIWMLRGAGILTLACGTLLLLRRMARTARAQNRAP